MPDNKKELALFGQVDPAEGEHLFFYRIYHKLKEFLPEEKRNADQQALLRLSQEELKRFGGDPLKREDASRAFYRAYKLINLGLEYTLGQTRKPEGGYDEDKARAILSQKSLIAIYQIGRTVFERDQKRVTELLKGSVVELGGMYFSLIDYDERKSLESLANIDRCSGHWREVSQAITVIPEIVLKLRIRPLLPLGYSRAWTCFRQFGSCDPLVFPSHIGLVRAALNSLLIAAMFRDKEDFYTFFSSRESRQLLKNLIKTGEIRLLNERTLHDFSRRKEYDARSTVDFLTTKDIAAKYSLLSQVLMVTPDEVRRFIETCYLEPHNFSQQVPKIRERFLWYFEVTRVALKTRVKKSVMEDAANLIDRIGRQLIEEIRDFYKQLEAPEEISDAALISFWHPRLFLNLGDLTHQTAAQLTGNRELPVSTFLSLPLAELAPALISFSFWPKEKQKAFTAGWNPNILAKEAWRTPTTWLELFHNLAPNAPGWDPAVVGQSAPRVTSSDQRALVTLPESAHGHLAQVLQKINWSRVHPYIVSELWLKGADLVRDLLYEKREELKVTVPSLQNYYLTWHRDLRLLEFALRKLHNQDLLTRGIWKDLQWRVHNQSQLSNFIRIVRREFAGGLKEENQP